MTAAAVLLRTCRPLCNFRKQFPGNGNFSRFPHVRNCNLSHSCFSPVVVHISTSQKPKLPATYAKHSTAPEPLLKSSAHVLRIPTGTVLPLNERAADTTVPLTALLEWHKQAVCQAQAVGSRYADADGGPTSDDLLVELNWLLDDAVAARQAPDANGWQPATWRQLEPRGLQLQIVDQLAGIGTDADTVAGNECIVALRADIAALTNLWRQRVEYRVPLQYLNNCCHWRDLILAVGPSVLIPRPETELLIDFAQQATQGNPSLAKGPWLDLGTGSGAIALGLASILPQCAQVYAVDKSPEAVAWAQLNVQRLRQQLRVQVITGSWYGPVQHMQGQFAGIISNPPYIPNHQMKTLQAEVGEHEPWLALDGGSKDGLDSLIPICREAASMLQPGGFLALETAGGEQAEQVAFFVRRARPGLENIQIKEDLAGVRRFVTASKSWLM